MAIRFVCLNCLTRTLVAKERTTHTDAHVLTTVHASRTQHVPTPHPTPHTITRRYAPWCGYCRRLTPIWEDLADDLKGKVNVAKLDADKHKGALCGLIWRWERCCVYYLIYGGGGGGGNTSSYDSATSRQKYQKQQCQLFMLWFLTGCMPLNVLCFITHSGVWISSYELIHDFGVMCERHERWGERLEWQEVCVYKILYSLSVGVAMQFYLTGFPTLYQ